MHEGHRERMKERLKYEMEGVQDHELLEMLLFYAIPRKNTNPIAHDLITSFGSLSAALKAPLQDLINVAGVGVSTAQFLKIVSEICGRVNLADSKVPRATSLFDFSKYIIARLRPLEGEVIELYCLDKLDRLKYTKRYTSEEPNKVVVSADEVCRFVALQNPAGLIVAHNHPKGPAQPSESDDRFTFQILMLCAANGTRLYDHVIVAPSENYSYFKQGQLDTMRAIIQGRILKELALP